LTEAAIGVIDVALWDLAGKAASLPIVGLLGLYTQRLPGYRTVGSNQLASQDLLQGNLLMAAAGVSAVKLQVWDGPDADIPRLAAARQLLGEDITLMHDPNGQYDLGQAIRVGRALTDLNYFWFEEPIPDAQITNLAYLRRNVDVPIVAGETARLAQLAEYIRADSVDALRGDVLIKAGVTGLRKALALAEMHGLRLEIHGVATPLLDIANLHVAGAARNSTFVEVHDELFRFGLKGRPLDPDEQGLVTVPSGPGLGVELDWDWLDDHTVELSGCP
jgi:L-alanine-DL-glutamate epimerase-like enolase superfamily enzyme